MPEIAEISRIVHFLKKYLKNRKIANVQFQDDTIVYGKVGTSGAEFASALKGKTILDARQQGKYFWLVMSSPPHPLMHFGMSGWLKFSHDQDVSAYTPGSKSAKGTKEVDEEDGREKNSWINSMESTADWPPKYWKFNLDIEDEPHVQAAFVDKRRLARIRLIDVPAEQMRKTTPLKENGPDPVIDKDLLTESWLKDKLLSKRVPVKALLLDQANISGIGNWVGDEILYNAKIHPEQYSNTLNAAQIKQLHKSMMYICDTSCELLADSDKFPKDWLMKHRWNKGRKEGSHLPNGEKIIHVTVGGRTSAIVPSVQKKTGPIAGQVNSEDDEEQPPKTSGTTKKGNKKTATTKAAKNEKARAEVSEGSPTASKKRKIGKTEEESTAKKRNLKTKRSKPDIEANTDVKSVEAPPRRTSSRVTRSSLK